MIHTLEEIRTDLLKLRRLLPANTHQSKGLFRKIDRALLAVARHKSSPRAVGGDL